MLNILWTLDSFKNKAVIKSKDTLKEFVLNVL